MQVKRLVMMTRIVDDSRRLQIFDIGSIDDWRRKQYDDAVARFLFVFRSHCCLHKSLSPRNVVATLKVKYLPIFKRLTLL